MQSELNNIKSSKAPAPVKLTKEPDNKLKASAGASSAKTGKGGVGASQDQLKELMETLREEMRQNIDALKNESVGGLLNAEKRIELIENLYQEEQRESGDKVKELQQTV